MSQGHVLTEKRWTDPFHGRRATFDCSCGWSFNGPAPAAIEEKANHIRFIPVDPMAVVIKPKQKPEEGVRA